MADSLKQKTVSGLIWSFVDNFSMAFVSFVVGVVLARLLSPEDYGLIGMTVIFTSISSSFINSGFSQALIRKQDCTNIDYSTVFYFNFIAGIVLFGLLFFSAPLISTYFNRPQLDAIVKVLSFVLIIDAFTVIQRTILTKRIDFKLQTKISVVASVTAGTVAIFMAYKGFGVWSLVAHQLAQRGVNTLLLWLWNRWVPQLVFSVQSFKELFSFGSKLMISGLIDTVYRNIYYLVIGKYFSAVELGYYTKAESFKNLPSTNLSGVIGRVSYPVLSSMQDDVPQLRENYRKLIRSTMFITFILMMGMAAVAEPMVITLIGEKWRPSIIYLQMLCFVGMFYPLHSLNLNMLNVMGRSDLFLKLEIVKKTLAVPTIIIGVVWGIKMMIAGMMVNTLIAFYLNSYYSGRFIDYSFMKQVKDILPSFSLSFSVSTLVFIFVKYSGIYNLYNLLLGLFLGLTLTILFCEFTNNKDYIYIKKIVKDKSYSIKN
jgi:teichuronic acid exporter